MWCGIDGGGGGGRYGWMEVEDGLILINIFYSSRIATRAHPSASTMPIPMPMFEYLEIESTTL